MNRICIGLYSLIDTMPFEYAKVFHQTPCIIYYLTVLEKMRKDAWMRPFIRIQTTKINRLYSALRPILLSGFMEIHAVVFCVILLTNQPRNKRTNTCITILAEVVSELNSCGSCVVFFKLWTQRGSSRVATPLVCLCLFKP